MGCTTDIHGTMHILSFYVRADLYVRPFRIMVPKAGLEPARLSPLPPQGSVYTNFTTSAETLIFSFLFEFPF